MKNVKSRLGFLILFPLFMSAGLYAQSSDLPGAYKQILPRGQIPAIFAPKYVPAQKAQIGEDSWVLGVVINGQARAYSLNLLNQHEVVNDKIGNTPFAAVW